jgi:hypothetical protein
MRENKERNRKTYNDHRYIFIEVQLTERKKKKRRNERKENRP